ncbi:hypothetical protein BT69DRAFT_187006 [Atractiella rhizophila]|nr:hypothetical protein BT69DRAFT_187006 [Atractiella rhizophila]
MRHCVHFKRENIAVMNAKLGTLLSSARSMASGIMAFHRKSRSADYFQELCANKSLMPIQLLCADLALCHHLTPTPQTVISTKTSSHESAWCEFVSPALSMMLLLAYVRSDKTVKEEPGFISGTVICSNIAARLLLTTAKKFTIHFSFDIESQNKDFLEVDLSENVELHTTFGFGTSTWSFPPVKGCPSVASYSLELDIFSLPDIAAICHVQHQTSPVQSVVPFQLLLFHKWDYNPFLDFPTELILACLNPMLISSNLSILDMSREDSFSLYHQNFRYIQNFRLVCRQFERAGRIALYRQIGAVTEMRGYPVGDTGSRLRIIDFLQQYDKELISWIKMLFLRPGDFPNNSYRWRFASLLFEVGHNVRTLVLQLQPPTCALQRQKIWLLVGHMKSLTSLYVEGMKDHKSTRWRFSDLASLFRAGRISHSLRDLYICGWDLLDFECELRPDTIDGSLLEVEVLDCKCTSSFFRWLSRLGHEIKDCAVQGFWPAPRYELDGFEDFLLENRDSMSEIRLIHVPITIDDLYPFTTTKFLKSLDATISSCKCLTWFYVDCGTEESNIVSSDFLESFDCPKVHTLYLYGTNVAVEKVIWWSQRQTQRLGKVNVFWSELWGDPEMDVLLPSLRGFPHLESELWQHTFHRFTMGPFRLYFDLAYGEEDEFRW